MGDAVPIDYRTKDLVEVIRRAEPDGLDAVIDGMICMDGIKHRLTLKARADAGNHTKTARNQMVGNWNDGGRLT